MEEFITIVYTPIPADDGSVPAGGLGTLAGVNGRSDRHVVYTGPVSNRENHTGH